MRHVGFLMACHALFAVAALAGLPSPAFAQSPGSQDSSAPLEEGYGDAFLHYRPYISPGKKPTPDRKLPPPAPPAPTPPTPAASEAKPEGRQPVDVAWLRKNYPILEERAINDPSEANVASYLYVKRVVMDKAQRFGEAVTKVTTEDPLLNENNRIPYASTGAQSVKNANYLAQQQAVRELSKFGGLLIFVDSTCRFCAMQLPIASMVRANFGIEYLVVSLDASAPKGFTGKVLADNGLFKKLGLRLTPSVVFVPKPQGYAGAIDPNRYLIVSQGFYAADELVKQIAFAGHQTSLLSKATTADLDVWDRGVAATADLGSLRLDPSQPEDIKATVQPLLLKQYKEGAR